MSGAIRYAGTPQYTKNTTPAEVQSLLAAGLEVHGVFEVSTSDFLGGFAAGVANAKLLLADANRCGIPGVLFMSADQHLSPAQVQMWQRYVAGAAAVLGSRFGVYGFSEAMNAAHGTAHYFWQCGAHPSQTGTAGFVNVWQRNSGQTATVISGIECDINDVLIGLDMPLTAADIDAIATATATKILNWPIVTPDKPAGTSGRAVWDVLGDGERNLTAAASLSDLVKSTASGQVDVTALATALAGPLATALQPLLPAGVTAAQVVTAMAKALSTGVVA